MESLTDIYVEIFNKAPGTTETHVWEQLFGQLAIKLDRIEEKLDRLNAEQQ